MGAQLAVEDEAAVRDAIAALEVAEGVVPAVAFPALRRPARSIPPSSSTR